MKIKTLGSSTLTFGDLAVGSIFQVIGSDDDSSTPVVRIKASSALVPYLYYQTTIVAGITSQISKDTKVRIVEIINMEIKPV